MFKCSKFYLPIFIVLFSFISSTQVIAQDIVTLTGTVTEETGSPMPGVTITADNEGIATITDAKGQFTIKLSVGKHLLKLSSIGYLPLQRNVDIQLKNGNLFFSMAPDNKRLQTVEIIGRNEHSYKSTMTFAGARTESRIIDIPQSIGYVTKEIIADQQAFRQIDIIKNVSGVNAYSYYTNDIVLRGFRASNFLINGLKNIAPGWTSSVLPNVEKMEVIKGPASALFGNTDPGGTINFITKKPLKENYKSINFSTGSFNTFRLTSDFTGPMDTAGHFLYRLNMAYQNAGSFRILQGGEDFVIAPSFSFIPSENTSVNFELVYTKSNSRLDRGQPIFGATEADGSSLLHSTPISFAIGKDNDYLHETNLFSTISIQQKINSQLSINASYMKSVYKEDLLEHRTSNRYAVDADGTAIPTLMEMRTIKRYTTTFTDNASIYGIYELKTGAVTQKILFGYDYMQNARPKDNNSAYNAAGYRNSTNTAAISRYNASRRNDYLIVNNMPVPNVPHFDLTNPDYSTSEIGQYINVSEQNENTPSKYYVNGVYIQDQIKWKKLQVLLGLRKEYYNDVIRNGEKDEQHVQQTAFIPRAGVVYSLLDNLNVYGTYAKGYQPQGAALVGNTAIYGGPFDPLKSNIIEFGAKTELFQQRLLLTVAAYKIEQNNILINANDPENPDRLRQLGQQQSKGIEMDASGSITPSLSLIANFSLSEAKITRSDNQEEVGRIMPNAPQVQGNIWAKYIIRSGKWKGLGIGVGNNYTGKRNTQNKSLQLPAYDITNAALFYTVNKFRLSANFNNIFNKTHWVGGYDYVRLFPGAPRNFLFSIGYTL